MLPLSTSVLYPVASVQGWIVAQYATMHFKLSIPLRCNFRIGLLVPNASIFAFIPLLCVVALGWNYTNPKLNEYSTLPIHLVDIH